MSFQPHSSWADVYDLAYQRSFGEFYNNLTDTTVEIIVKRIKPPARIVDFGSGTGRLSIPLAQRGYDVTAVDPCQEMLSQLLQKKPQGTISTVCSKMEDFFCKEEFDGALCVFTVLLYFLNEESLEKGLATAYASLRFGGILILDIPSEATFRGYSFSDHVIERSVSVVRHAGNTFNYREELGVKCADGDVSKYQDEFLIRFWPQDQVMKTLKNIGFVQEEDLSNYFSGTGANYYIMKKA